MRCEHATNTDERRITQACPSHENQSCCVNNLFALFRNDRKSEISGPVILTYDL